MYINGRNTILEALRDGAEQRLEKIFVMFGSEGEPIDQIRSAARRAGVPCVTADRKRFGELERSANLGTRSQGVIALISDVEYSDIEAIVEDVTMRGIVPLITALDGITDPHNVGAIIRSAECAGLHGLLTGERDSASITDVVMKTSAGAAGHFPIGRVPNVGDVLTTLSQTGVAVVGLDERAEMPYTAYDFTAPTVIVIGSEGKGLGKRIKSICTELIRIPMHGKIGSLNASVAAGVVFFEAERQRGL